MGSYHPSDFDFDVIIIGAGISGINTAFRIQTEFPKYSYTILEARSSLGGTWDLFKYPGIRSDSDLHTFGFSWRPWQKANPIADGDSIKAYMRECAEMYGIDKKIRYHHKLNSANWSTVKQQWELAVQTNTQNHSFRGRFVVMGTGYYNYDTPLESHIPGLERFQGKTIHPQFWPEKLEYDGKKIVVIGSGATAITLVPSLVKEGAEKVTMLQRSPSYILSLPQKDVSGDLVRRLLPSWLARRLIRLKFLIIPFLFFKFCRAFPNAARNVLRKAVQKEIPNMQLDPNFSPTYNPWDQRMCLCPDGDFFAALKSGRADIVTDHISTVTETGILTETGTTLDADIIVTATGLKMQMAGGARISIDDVPINIPQKFVWRGLMLQDVPNMAVVIGYTNASWTLGADTAAKLVCRLLKHMDKNGQSSAVATVEKGSTMKPQRVLNLNSTYIVKAKGDLPMAGDQAPFLPRSNYFADYTFAAYGNLTKGLEFGTRATV